MNYFQTLPKLSVITLVYNVEPYIERCLNSILTQNLGDFEVLLVVELRSNDKSIDICKRFADTDKRIKILKEDGTGFPAARNHGLIEARGEYVTFVDSDDYILPEMFSVMYSEAKKQNTDMLCCGGKKDLGGQQVEDMGDYIKFDNKLFVINPQNQRNYMYKLAVNGRSITAWGKLYNRSFLNENNLRFHPDAYSDDFAFNFACYTTARRVATIEQSFYVYYDRHDSRVYSSETSDVVRSAEILWELYQSYHGVAPECVKAYAAARIISSTLFNLKLKPLSIDKICSVVWNIIQNQGMCQYLLHAADKDNFRGYADVTAMTGQTAENYRLFIESLQSYDTLLAWQTRYTEAKNERMRI